MTYNEKIISMNNDLLDHQHKELFEISKKLSLEPTSCWNKRVKNCLKRVVDNDQ